MINCSGVYNPRVGLTRIDTNESNNKVVFLS